MLFATAAEWVARLADAHHAGRLQAELVRLGRYPLLVVDEVGYIPFEAEAANLFFQLVSARYERASLIVTSNKPFGRWGEVFGDDVVAAAMIDRLVHHAEVVALKGDSYRLKDRDLGRVPAATTDEPMTSKGVSFHPSPGGQFSAVVDKAPHRSSTDAFDSHLSAGSHSLPHTRLLGAKLLAFAAMDDTPLRSERSSPPGQQPHIGKPMSINGH